MFFIKFLRRFISLVLVIILLWTGTIPNYGQIAAANAQTINNQEVVTQQQLQTSNSWYEIDKDLAKAVRNAYNTTEDYAINELNNWEDELLKKVDDQFLNWYFSYGNQKLMDFGVPFAWAAFTVDSVLKVLRKEDEKDLNAEEIIKNRMIEDFNHKFQELVLNDEAEKNLKLIVENIGRNYASSLGIKFAQVKYYYKIDNYEWEKHLNQISQLIYNTGNNESTLEAESFNSNLFTKTFVATTTTISLKLAANFASKTVSKIALKTGSKIAAETILSTATKLIEPILIVGFLAWDVWDYNQMVAKSQPELRENISDYLNEVKQPIIEAITDTIRNVERKFLDAIESQSIQY